MKVTSFFPRLVLIFIGLIAGFILTEIVLLLLPDGLTISNAKYALCDPCKRLYGLEAGADGTNSLGFVGHEISITKPVGVKRIVIMGDSVTQGTTVNPDITYSALLEKHFKNSNMPIEVINAGVTGYNPYNERYAYIEHIRNLKPDLVILQTCMNDVAEPELHWNLLREKKVPVPVEAIPNKTYHQEALDNLPWYLDPPSLALRSNVLTLIFHQILENRAFDVQTSVKKESAGVKWPAFITGEDYKDVSSLLNYDSEEWNWLRSQYDPLIKAVKDDGSKFLFLVVPMAYQFRNNYPFSPQDNFLRYAKDNNLPAINLFEELKSKNPAEAFSARVLEENTAADHWHFSAKGHEQVASILFENNIIRELLDLKQ